MKSFDGELFMSDLNQVVISGRLTKDAQFREVKGSSLAEISIASNRVWNDRSGNKQEETVFIDVDLWGKQAEYFGNNLQKGSYIMVTGRLRREVWDSPDGQKRTRISIRADKIDLPPLSSNGTSTKSKDTRLVHANVEPEVDFENESVPF